jgi:hypothetical protein
MRGSRTRRRRRSGARTVVEQEAAHNGDGMAPVKLRGGPEVAGVDSEKMSPFGRER